MQSSFLKQSYKLVNPSNLLFRSALPTRQFASGTTFEKFDFEDPFKLNEILTDEERAISDIARSYS